jgi:hypothetical protein
METPKKKWRTVAACLATGRQLNCVTPNHAKLGPAEIWAQLASTAIKVDITRDSVARSPDDGNFDSSV